MSALSSLCTQSGRGASKRDEVQMPLPSLYPKKLPLGSGSLDEEEAVKLNDTLVSEHSPKQPNPTPVKSKSVIVLYGRDVHLYVMCVRV